MMNYSDYDSDGYQSNEDVDYVPSDDNVSEDDINECEKEDPLHEDDSVPHPDYASREKKKKKKVLLGMRKRKKGVLEVDEEKNSEEKPLPEQGEEGEEVEEKKNNQGDDDEVQKKKSDDLWASFLFDVGSRPKDEPASESSPAHKDDPSELKVAPVSTKTSPPARVTITKVFDFAGEEVRVDKDVLADSKEAKSFIKSQNTQQEEDEDLSPSQSPVPGPSAKRPAGMMNLLNRMGGKKPKMSTLEKSKMDWDSFKSEEGITEELATHNRGKEGYVERKRFLERVDTRQFELEKAVRLNNMKQ